MEKPGPVIVISPAFVQALRLLRESAWSRVYQVSLHPNTRVDRMIVTEVCSHCKQTCPAHITGGLGIGLGCKNTGHVFPNKSKEEGTFLTHYLGGPNSYSLHSQGTQTGSPSWETREGKAGQESPILASQLN